MWYKENLHTLSTARYILEVIRICIRAVSVVPYTAIGTTNQWTRQSVQCTWYTEHSMSSSSSLFNVLLHCSTPHLLHHLTPLLHCFITNLVSWLVLMTLSFHLFLFLLSSFDLAFLPLVLFVTYSTCVLSYFCCFLFYYISLLFFFLLQLPNHWWIT